MLHLNLSQRAGCARCHNVPCKCVCINSVVRTNQIAPRMHVTSHMQLEVTKSVQGLREGQGQQAIRAAKYVCVFTLFVHMITLLYVLQPKDLCT